METRIQKEYVIESKRIIESYQHTMKQINGYTDLLINNKNVLLQMQPEIDAIKLSTDPELLKHQKAYDTMMKYEAEINKLHTLLQPHLDQLKQIEKDSKIMYATLLEKYPMYNEKQLQEQLFKQLDELKEKGQ